ncbi:ABC transporter substrate-binding protein [uncultured Ferrimonas sp.]|uniref:heme/hemin ABC transporter substrate-binding protein n=1 Tax=uncultured Ferrimonas sp. TaxID=432640 RepID=UPI002624F312|nr:ABC transporter substrate-binding protein [uncultured Ferrimonas sp.]
MNSITKLASSAVLLALTSLPTVAAERVVSVGYGLTELVLALGAETKLVGIDMGSKTAISRDNIAELGYHRALSAEGLLTTKPDLVMGSEEMGPETSLNVLRDAGINVQVLPSADTPEQLLNNVGVVADLLDRNDAAEPLRQQLRGQLDHIVALRESLQRQPTVLFMLLRGDRGPRLGGDGTPADRLIKLAGGINGAGFSGYKTINQETLLKMNPDLILVTKPSEDGDKVDSANLLLKELPLLKFTAAGQQQQIHKLPASALMGGLGPSALTEVEALAQRLVEIH